MRKYSRLGLADVEYRRGGYDIVLRDSAKMVESIKALAKGDGPIKMKDYKVTGEFLGLVLRANVQKAKIEEAKGILRLMERLTGEEAGVGAETVNVLRSLVEDLQVQVRDLKKAGDPTKLKETITNFSTFLDELVKGAEAKKALDLGDITFLANCYMSLEQFCKAAGLFARVPAPKALEKDAKMKLDEKEEKAVATYWFVQVQHAKALRQCGKEKGAREELEQANKLLGGLLRHPHARMQLLAEKEKVHILEDLALYGSATKGWKTFIDSVKSALRNPDLPADTRARLKEMYFESFYHNYWCVFKLSQTEKVRGTAQEKKYLQVVARNILNLERDANREGWDIAGPHFEELMRVEPKLRDEYEEMKKTTK
jgi:hypothetical protein